MACSSPRSTRDKVSFDLCDLREKETTSERKRLLIEKINDKRASLESNSGEEIASFCIGKSYAGLKKKGLRFDPMNEDTWSIDGIVNRWRSKYKSNKYHGLVVLAAVTRAMLDERCNTDVWDEELYTLALESALISHYAFEVFDHRLDNTSLNPGSSKKGSAGYVIYLAFKYQEAKEIAGGRKAEKKRDRVKGKDSKKSKKPGKSECTITKPMEELSLK